MTLQISVSSYLARQRIYRLQCSCSYHNDQAPPPTPLPQHVCKQEHENSLPYSVVSHRTAKLRVRVAGVAFPRAPSHHRPSHSPPIACGPVPAGGRKRENVSRFLCSAVAPLGTHAVPCSLTSFGVVRGHERRARGNLVVAAELHVLEARCCVPPCWWELRQIASRTCMCVCVFFTCSVHVRDALGMTAGGVECMYVRMGTDWDGS